MTLGTIHKGGWGIEVCDRCGNNEHSEHLTRNKPHCRPCRRDIRLVETYGLSAAEVDAIIAANQGLCPICERATKRWAVDHDHSCCPGQGKNTCGGCVRGIICDTCNRGIGSFQDSPDALRRAAEYLERSRT